MPEDLMEVTKFVFGVSITEDVLIQHTWIDDRHCSDYMPTARVRVEDGKWRWCESDVNPSHWMAIPPIDGECTGKEEVDEVIDNDEVETPR